MTGSTSPLGFPYLTPADNLSDLSEVMQQLAEAVDDYLSSLSAVAPTPWVTVSGASTGWGGSVQYARRAGMVTVNVLVTRSTFNPTDGIIQLPSGFRPDGVIVHGVGAYDLALRPFGVSSDGWIRVEGLTAQTNGIYGSVTYPV